MLIKVLAKGPKSDAPEVCLQCRIGKVAAVLVKNYWRITTKAAYVSCGKQAEAIK
jgi:hypothetical protein